MKYKGLTYIKKLLPITEEDREFKAFNDAEGNCTDLGEDIELKLKLAKKFHWKPAKEPLIRVLMRSGNIILYRDYYYHYMIDMEQYKDYDL